LYALKLASKNRYWYRSLAWLCTRYATLFLLLVANHGAASENPVGRDAEQYFFDQSFKDFQEELDIVEEEKKQGILVFFDMVGCPYCLYMKEKVLSQELVQQWYHQHFRSIRVDIHGATEVIDFDGQELTETTFAARYGVFSTPTMIFFDMEGNEIYRHLKTVKTPAQLVVLGEAVLVKTK
jgi:thioredoxin-related protein